jgi:tetrapyrrole methylase family protein/MazG family protein
MFVYGFPASRQALSIVLSGGTVTAPGVKFDRFVEVVRELRSANGCPWDREQTPLSLKRYLLEETQELLAAIDGGDPHHVKEELGDLLYIIILLAQIHSEEDLFDIGAVIESISTKMIRRHPHVFSDEKIESVAELRRKWLEIKKKEKAGHAEPKKN